MEIFPTAVPAADGRPKALANSGERRSLPSVMVSELRTGIVSIQSSFNIEKDEPVLAVAHGKIKGCAEREFFDCQLPEGRAQWGYEGSRYFAE